MFLSKQRTFSWYGWYVKLNDPASSYRVFRNIIERFILGILLIRTIPMYKIINDVF